MTFAHWWETLGRRHTVFQKPEARIKVSVAEIERIARMAYEAGKTEGREHGLGSAFVKRFGGNPLEGIL